jgi:RNA-directed DNA polymerase
MADLARHERQNTAYPPQTAHSQNPSDSSKCRPPNRPSFLCKILIRQLICPPWALQPSPKTSGVLKFLGFSFTGWTEPRRRIAPQAIARFKAKVRELTRRTCGKSLTQVAKELSTYLVGWRGYFGFCQTPSVLHKLDKWIRRRLRAIAWKQWKHGPARFAELRRRGVGRDLAAQTAGSPHGPWRLANSPALAIALPNSFFDSLGLASVATLRPA